MHGESIKINELGVWGDLVGWFGFCAGGGLWVGLFFLCVCVLFRCGFVWGLLLLAGCSNFSL